MLLDYIIIFLFGILMGNFTTTIFYRLPRNITIGGFNNNLAQSPFCSNCGHLLRFYEYLPILSWFSTFGKCNYCRFPITKSYLALEIVIGFNAVILYILFGTNLEYFLIYFCYTTLVILNIFIYLEHNIIPTTITLCIMMLGIIYRTLLDQEISSWLSSLSIAFIISLWIMNNSKCYSLSQNNTSQAKDNKSQDNSSQNNVLQNNSSSLQNNGLALFIHIILPASLWCPNYKLYIITGSLLLSHVLSKLTIDKLFYPLCAALMTIISLWY